MHLNNSVRGFRTAFASDLAKGRPSVVAGAPLAGKHDLPKLADPSGDFAEPQA